MLSVKRCESPLMNNTIKLLEECSETAFTDKGLRNADLVKRIDAELHGRAFHKIRGYPDFTIAFDYDDDLFHIFNNDTEIATCDTASEAKRIVKTN